MSDYKMDIKGTLGLSEYSNIYDYMGVVDKNDSFTIVLDNENKKDINIIESMLKESNFSIINQGYTEKGDYYISASKYESNEIYSAD